MARFDGPRDCVWRNQALNKSITPRMKRSKAQDCPIKDRSSAPAGGRVKQAPVPERLWLSRVVVGQEPSRASLVEELLVRHGGRGYANWTDRAWSRAFDRWHCRALARLMQENIAARGNSRWLARRMSGVCAAAKSRMWTVSSPACGRTRRNSPMAAARCSHPTIRFRRNSNSPCRADELRSDRPQVDAPPYGLESIP